MPEKIEARSSVEIADSCNCNECCPRSCCLPFGRRIKKENRRCSSEGEIEVTTTTVKAHGVSQAHLTKSGKWEIELDGKKIGIDGQEIKE